MAVWNGLPGVTALSRFTDRNTAVARIWKTLQNAAESTKVSRPARGKRRTGSKQTLAREGTKKARILILLKRPKGATVDDIMTATGWQAHSVRGFISGNLIKRRGQRLPFDERAAEEAEWRIDEPWHVIRALFEDEQI